VIVVDDDQAFRNALCAALELEGWSPSVMSTAEAMEAPAPAPLAAVLLEPCPLGVLDVRLLSTILSEWRTPRAFVVTCYPSLALGMACVRAGVEDCYAKPIRTEYLVRILNGAVVAPDVRQQRESLSLARVQHEFIAQTLRESNWNISVAARTLGIQRSTLQRKLRKMPPSAVRAEAEGPLALRRSVGGDG
jgi:two-component system response regulator RegA